MSVTAGTPAMLRDRAAAVLHGNDAGSWTKASPHLYPYQWSWDSAFNAIGWAHLDVRRAMAALEEPFAAQWSTGMVPHIVFRAGPDEPYFPGPEWWDCVDLAPAAPALPVQTTGFCQPPVSAVLVAANTALLDLADVAGASDGDRGQLACWRDRGREGLARCFDAESGLCLDYDVRAGEQIRLRTFTSNQARPAEPHPLELIV